MTSLGNPMETLLAELQAMVAEKSTPEVQLKEKLETIRATRRKAKADLIAAQEDVVQLLTMKQIAALVALGYLD
jgi:hypothetical protein